MNDATDASARAQPWARVTASCLFSVFTCPPARVDACYWMRHRGQREMTGDCRWGRGWPSLPGLSPIREVLPAGPGQAPLLLVTAGPLPAVTYHSDGVSPGTGITGCR